MSEQLPQMNYEEHNKPHKTEAEIASQIGRITQKLVERNANLGDDALDELYVHTGRSESTEDIASVTIGEEGGLLKEGDVMLEKIQVDKYRPGATLPRSEKRATISVASQKGEASGDYLSRRFDSDRSPEFAKLTNDETITASASVLGKIRAEIAGKEQEQRDEARRKAEKEHRIAEAKEAEKQSFLRAS